MAEVPTGRPAQGTGLPPQGVKGDKKNSDLMRDITNAPAPSAPAPAADFKPAPEAPGADKGNALSAVQVKSAVKVILAGIDGEIAQIRSRLESIEAHRDTLRQVVNRLNLS